jgi:GNAT superfamily N-acetyltransferase
MRSVTATARIAGAADVAELVRVINGAYVAEAFFINGVRTNRDEAHALLEREGACFLAIDDPAHTGRLVACVFVQLRGNRGYFGMLSVDPSHQGKGLARALIDAVEDHCRARGCVFLDISVVNLRRELPAFYARFGFAAYDTAPFPEPYKLTRPAHLVLMTKPLVALFDRDEPS